jgi:D-arabinose 1-dehydrogenase-like Zn-dependent alcohol dehydrogenase
MCAASFRDFLDLLPVSLDGQSSSCYAFLRSQAPELVQAKLAASIPPEAGVRLLLSKLKRESQYDLILDVAAYRSVFDYLPILKPTGSYVLIGGSTARFFQVMLFGTWISRISGRKVQCLASKPNQADLVILRDLLKAGKIVPLIDRRFNLSEVPTAINYLEQRQVLGKVAILTSCINLV